MHSGPIFASFYETEPGGDFSLVWSRSLGARVGRCPVEAIINEAV
jgi:hypothetical protein